MASTKQRADKQKEKERKEKILLVVLLLVLVVVGAVMLPGMLKKKGKPAVTDSATTGTSLSATDSGTASASGISASGPLGAATFPDVSTTFQAGPGQLSSFGRLAGSDPFASPVQTGTGNVASTSTSASTSTTSTSGASFDAAVISINGAPSLVALHSTFPAASQAFILDSITAGSITVSVTNGSFTGGRSLVTIRKGHTVVLENTVDATRYALKMISAVAGGASGGTVTSPGTSVGITTSPDTSTGATTDTSTGTTTFP